MSGVREMEVVLYSKSNCPFCVRAKDWFDSHGFTYTENKLDDEEQRLAFYQRLNGVQENISKGSENRPVNSVPQIFIDGKHIGGYDQLCYSG